MCKEKRESVARVNLYHIDSRSKYCYFNIRLALLEKLKKKKKRKREKKRMVKSVVK